MSEIRNETLSVYKIDFVDSGPEIMLSVTIQEDFSWIVSYRREHIKREFCGILIDMPSEINTGIAITKITYSITAIYLLVSRVSEVLRAVSGAEVCEGNSDERFLALPNIHKNTMKDISSAYVENIMYTCILIRIASGYALIHYLFTWIIFYFIE